MLVRVTATLKKASSPKKDDVKNVFHVLSKTGTAITGTQFAAWQPLVIAFYNAVAIYISPTINRATGAQEISWAKVTTGGTGAADDTVQPSPLLSTWSLNPVSAGATALPPEVAVCLSHVAYGASPGEGPKEGPRPAARQRGRLYIGPLASSAVAATGGVVNPTMVTDLSLAWKNLVVAFQNLAAPNAADIGVYSPTSDTFFYDQSCYVDNAFDTVRSRGVDATARTYQYMSNSNTSMPGAEGP